MSSFPPPGATPDEQPLATTSTESLADVGFPRLTRSVAAHPGPSLDKAGVMEHQPSATSFHRAARRPPATVDDLAERARRYLRLRRARDNLFGSDVFADPAWDILLDLYVARAERRQVSIKCACAASAVPATTALRWITLLERRQIIVRVDDDEDRRRALLFLMPGTLASIEMWLAAMP